MHPITMRTYTLGDILRFLGVILLLSLIVWYVLFQARNILTGPMITLNDTGNMVHEEQRIVLMGTTQNIVKLTLNGKEIYTNEAGAFTHPLILENGYTIMTLEAFDRFGRNTILHKEFVYAPIAS